MVKKFRNLGHEIEIVDDEDRVIICELPDEIEKIIHVKDAFFVMTDTNKEIRNRNIFKISMKGVIEWQIQDPFEFRGVKSDRSAAFTYLGYDAQQNLRGGAMDCFSYVIDVETGKLTNPEFTK